MKMNGTQQLLVCGGGDDDSIMGENIKTITHKLCQRLSREVG
jgi:hypothetical protein